MILGASNNGIVGWEGGILKVKISSAPEKGKANGALIELLSKTYKIPKSKIRILSGEKSRKKRVLLIGIKELGPAID